MTAAVFLNNNARVSIELWMFHDVLGALEALEEGDDLGPDSVPHVYLSAGIVTRA